MGATESTTENQNETLGYSTIKPGDIRLRMKEEKESRIKKMMEKMQKDYDNFNILHITNEANKGNTKVMLNKYSRDSNYTNIDEVMKEALIRLNKKTLYMVKCNRFSYNKGGCNMYDTYKVFIDWVE